VEFSICAKGSCIGVKTFGVFTPKEAENLLPKDEGGELFTTGGPPTPKGEEVKVAVGDEAIPETGVVGDSGVGHPKAAPPREVLLCLGIERGGGGELRDDIWSGEGTKIKD
jgi:hypothetical protein